MNATGSPGLRPPINPSNPYGTDLALAIKSTAGHRISLSYWDLWMLLAARERSDDNLDRLAVLMRRRRDGDAPTVWGPDREDWKRRLSHLRDFQARLRAAGVTMPDVLVAAGDLATRERRRAWPKVMEKPVRQAEISGPMSSTPEERGREYALRGFWDRFPVSPASYADEIGACFGSRGGYSENQSFSVARRFDTYVERGVRLAAASRHAEALALLRATMTVILEVVERADDSCGVIGDAFQTAFRAYLKLPIERTGIDTAVFLHDLLTLLIWEDYGFTHGATRGFFRRLPEEQGQACLDFLRKEIARLEAEDLDYQAKEALTLLGQIAGEQRRWDLFEALAREMGAREWERILRLANEAVKGRKRDLALQVFDAALRRPGGMHRELLLAHQRRLKRRAWKPGLRAD